MEWIRTWALAVCFACVGCGILLQLVPNSSLQRVMRTAVNLFFLVCIMVPVTQISPADLRLTLEQTVDVEEYTSALEELNRQLIQQQVCGALQEKLVSYLNQLGIEKNISVNVNTEWSDSISIISVDIQLDEDYASRKQWIEQKLCREFQLEFQVSCREEEAENG